MNEQSLSDFRLKLMDKYDAIEKKEQRIEELANELQQKERTLSRAMMHSGFMSKSLKRSMMI